MTFLDFLRKTFGPDGIFSSGQEGHAFLIGFSEVMCPWKPRWDMPKDYVANGDPLHEYHYYMFGRAAGSGPGFLYVVSSKWCSFDAK